MAGKLLGGKGTGSMSRIRNRLRQERGVRGHQRHDVIGAYVLQRRADGLERYCLVVNLDGEQRQDSLTELVMEWAARNGNPLWVSFRWANPEGSILRHDNAEQAIGLARKETDRVVWCLALLDDGARWDDDNLPCVVGQVYPVLERQSATLGLHQTVQANFSRQTGPRVKRGSKLRPDAELESSDKPHVASKPVVRQERSKPRRSGLWFPVLASPLPRGCDGTSRTGSNATLDREQVAERMEQAERKRQATWERTAENFDSVPRLPLSPVTPWSIPTCYVAPRGPLFSRPTCKPGQRFA